LYSLCDQVGGNYPLSLSEPEDIADSIALLWWAQRENIPNKSQYSTQFAKNINEISLYREDNFTTKRILSDFEIALLFEAIAREFANPDIGMLFDYRTAQILLLFFLL